MKILTEKRVDWKQLKQSVFRMYPKSLGSLDFDRIETFLSKSDLWKEEEEKKNHPIKYHAIYRKCRQNFIAIIKDSRTDEIVAILKNTEPVKNFSTTI